MSVGTRTSSLSLAGAIGCLRADSMEALVDCVLFKAS